MTEFVFRDLDEFAEGMMVRLPSGEEGIVSRLDFDENMLHVAVWNPELGKEIMDSLDPSEPGLVILDDGETS